MGYAFSIGWNCTDSLSSCVVLTSVIMHAMLEKKMNAGDYVQEFVHLQSASAIVGKFVGWLMNFPALPNCVSMFHSSTGGSNTMSLTLHDLFFQLPDFQCECSVHCVQYGQFNIQAFTSSSIFLAPCSSSKLYHLSEMKMFLCCFLCHSETVFI